MDYSVNIIDVEFPTLTSEEDIESIIPQDLLNDQDNLSCPPPPGT